MIILDRQLSLHFVWANIDILLRYVALNLTLNSASAKFRKWHNRDIISYLLFEGNVVGER